MKKCNSCNETNLGRFCRDKNTPDGLSYYCKKCNKERHLKWYEKNRQWVNEQSKLWRENNPERYKLIAKRSSDKNREKRIKRASKYRKDHPELIRAQQRKYVQNNKKKVLESKRKWNLAHPDLAKAYHLANQRLREARKKKVTVGNREEIKRFYIYVHTSPYIECAYCNEPVPKGKRHVDHIIPLSQNGEHSLPNLAPACSTCNLKNPTKRRKNFWPRSIQMGTFRFDFLGGKWDGYGKYVPERKAMYICFPRNTTPLLVTADNQRYVLKSIDFKKMSCQWVPTDEKYPTNTITGDERCTSRRGS